MGRASLAAIEKHAAEYRYRKLWLETRRVNGIALAFYERNGYRVIPNYGRYVGRDDAVCLGKDL